MTEPDHEGYHAVPDGLLRVDTSRAQHGTVHDKFDMLRTQNSEISLEPEDPAVRSALIKQYSIDDITLETKAPKESSEPLADALRNAYGIQPQSRIFNDIEDSDSPP